MTFGIWAVLRALMLSRAQLAAENAALRHQLTVFQRSTRRPKLRRGDRIFWVWLSKLWGGWRDALLIVQPETVVKWHRQGFKLYWRGKSTRRKVGRPKLDGEVRELIRQMSSANPLWGAPNRGLMPRRCQPSRRCPDPAGELDCVSRRRLWWH